MTLNSRWKKVYISPTFRVENDPFPDLPIFKVVPASSLKLYYIFYLSRVGTSVSSENSSLPSIFLITKEFDGLTNHPVQCYIC